MHALWLPSLIVIPRAKQRCQVAGFPRSFLLFLSFNHLTRGPRLRSHKSSQVLEDLRRFHLWTWYDLVYGWTSATSLLWRVGTCWHHYCLVGGSKNGLPNKVLDTSQLDGSKAPKRQLLCSDNFWMELCALVDQHGTKMLSGRMYERPKARAKCAWLCMYTPCWALSWFGASVWGTCLLGLSYSAEALFLTNRLHDESWHGMEDVNKTIFLFWWAVRNHSKDGIQKLHHPIKNSLYQ